MLNIIFASPATKYALLNISRPRHISELVLCFKGQNPEKRDKLGEQIDHLPAEMWRSTKVTRQVWKVKKFSAPDR